jgi:WD40 repeat protein
VSVDGDIAFGAIDRPMVVRRLDTYPASIAFDGATSQIAFAGFGVVVYDLSSGERRATYRQPLGPGGRGTYESVAFTPDGKIVAASLDGVDPWRVGDTRVSQGTIKCDCAADGVALSGDGQRAVFGTADGHVVVIDAQDGRVLTDRTVSADLDDHVFAVAASDDARIFVAFSASGAGLLWDQRARRVVWRGRLMNVFPTRVAFSEDRALLVETQTNESDAGTGFGLAPWLVPLT